MSNEDLLFDVRVVKHHIRRGETSRAAYQEHLDKLEDVADKGVDTSTTFSNSWEVRHHSGGDAGKEA